MDDSQDGNGRSLDIVNLGRAIGPMSKLNPKVLLQGLSSGTKSTIREQVPVGVYEYKIKNPVDWSENISFPPADDAFDIRVTNLIDLNSEGDYYVDEAKNTVYTYSPTENSAYPFITYVTNPSTWGGGSSYSMSNFNTIPSINQLGYLDLNITQNSSGVYEFSFPAIAYTSRSEDQSALVEQSSVLYGATYTLPASIRAVCGGNYFTENSGITNTTIPEGMIYLKNATTGEIYSDASYYYNNDSSVLVEGVELDLSMDWIRNDDGVNFSTSLNWSTNDAIVVDLGEDTDRIVYAGFGTLGNAAIPGESLGSIIGSSITRSGASIEDSRWVGGDGGLIVNNQGSYDETFDPTIIGDANPDWIANISNSVSFKNLSLNFLFNFQAGGDIYSTTVATLLGRGLTTDTLDRELSFILPGVNNGQPNTKQINNSTFYFSNVLYGPDEMRIYDATHWRLGEVSLSYNLPKRILDNTPFGNISITASGFNLFYDAINMPDGTNFDPNIAGVGVGNGRGFDFLNGPSAKRYGASVKLTF